jgi:hypothetical protein
MVDDGVADFQEVIDTVPTTVAAQVPPLVAEAIAADSTVADAAAVAVAGAVESEGLLTGAKVMPDDVDQGIAFAITDAQGRRSWLEVLEGGGPSDHAREFIAEGLPLPSEVPATTGAAYVVTDAEGREAFRVSSDGTFIPQKFQLPTNSVTIENVSPELRESLTFTQEYAAISVGVAGSRRIEVNQTLGGSVTAITTSGDYIDPQLISPEVVTFKDAATGILYYDNPLTPTGVRPYVSSPVIAAYGDSLTAANYPNDLATLMGGVVGVDVIKRGISSQTPSQIVGRQGGEFALVTVAGDSIPASGQVSATINVSILRGATSITGTLAGRHGTLRGGTTTPYTFEQDAGGVVTPCPPNTPFKPDGAFEDENRTQIYWYGRNNPNDVGPWIAKSVAFLKPRVKRFLILGQINQSNGIEPIGNATYNVIKNYNLEMAAKYGDSFIDIRRWLVDSAIYEMGITPTVDDLADMAGDMPPRSVMNDPVHPNAACYTRIANQVFLRLQQKGWV